MKNITEKQIPNILRMAEEKLDSVKLINHFLEIRKTVENYTLFNIVTIERLENSFIKSNYNINHLNLLNSLSVDLSSVSRRYKAIPYFDIAVNFVNKIIFEHEDIFDKLIKGYINDEYYQNRLVYSLILSWITFFYISENK